MNKLTPTINVDDEIAHVASYIQHKWDAPFDFTPIARDICTAATQISRTWFDGDDLSQHAAALAERRKTLLEQLPDMPSGSSPDYFDAISTLLDHVDLNASKLATAGRHRDKWDFDNGSALISRQLLEKYPEMLPIRPKDWDSIPEEDGQLPGWDTYDADVDRALFDGADAKLTYMCDFPAAIALPLVAAKERLANQPAAKQLIVATLAHFLAIFKFLNTEELKRDLVAALPRLAVEEMIFDRKDVSTSNKILKVAFKMALPPYSKQEFDDSVKAAAAFEALSPEEKEQNTIAFEKELEAMMNPVVIDRDNATSFDSYMALLREDFPALL